MYLLMVVIIFFEDVGEESQFRCKGFMNAQSFTSEYQRRQDCVFVGWMVMGFFV